MDTYVVIYYSLLDIQGLRLYMKTHPFRGQIIGVQRVEVPDRVYLEHNHGLDQDAIADFFNHRGLLSAGGKNVLLEIKAKKGMLAIKFNAKKGKCLSLAYSRLNT